MPFTPLHFGPSACIALPLRRHLDVPAFILATLFIDIEPFSVMILKWSSAEHPIAHSLTIGTLVGVLWGFLAIQIKPQLSALMQKVRLSHAPAASKTLVSAILGVWLHVLLDAMIYPEIKLLFPWEGNALLGIISEPALIWACAALFIPAAWLYFLARR